MKALTFTGLVQNGLLPVDVRNALAVCLRGLEGKQAVVTVAERKKRRSTRQNAYYWSTVVPLIVEMFREAGNDVDAEEVHAYLKEYVGRLTKLVTMPDGTRRTVVRSSKTLDTAEWEAFMEAIRAWAASFGWRVPLPNEGITYPEVA